MKTRILLGPGLYDPKGNEAFLVKAIKKVTEDAFLTKFGLRHGRVK